jgi:hypothetical protein
MARIAPTVLVVVLLAATVAAFARTALLKLESIPITGPRVTKEFSPVCDCPNSRAEVSFRLRKADLVTVSIVDRDGDEVAKVVSDRRYPAGRVAVVWRGRTDAGAIAPEGVYRPKVTLDRGGRTIVLPNPIRVDVRAPRVTLESARPTRISPDGDGVRDGVRLRYSLSERANVALLVNGKQRARSRFRPLEGSIGWFGIVKGKPVPAGRYRLQLVATDIAGNRSKPTAAVTVRVRYVDLSRTRIRAVAGRRFGVRYSTDAKVVRWRLGNRSGLSRDGRIEVTAPLQPGTFTLVVTANGKSARAAVYVRRAGPAVAAR